LNDSWIMCMPLSTLFLWHLKCYGVSIFSRTMVTYDFFTHTTTLDCGPHNIHINMTTHNIVAMLDFDKRQTLMHFVTSNQNFTIPTFGPIHITNFYLPKPLVNISPCYNMCIMLLVWLCSQPTSLAFWNFWPRVWSILF
jgi:hypothetical protein